MKKLLLTGLAFCFSVSIVLAQQGGPPGGGAGGSVPIDGGLGILMASGIAFGVHQYRKNKKAD